MPRHADVAQLVEQLIRNEKVGGSTPLIGTRHHGLIQSGHFFRLPFLYNGLRLEALHPDRGLAGF